MVSCQKHAKHFGLLTKQVTTVVLDYLYIGYLTFLTEAVVTSSVHFSFGQFSAGLGREKAWKNPVPR